MSSYSRDLVHSTLEGIPAAHPIAVDMTATICCRSLRALSSSTQAAQQCHEQILIDDHPLFLDDIHRSSLGNVATSQTFSIRRLCQAQSTFGSSSPSSTSWRSMAVWPPRQQTSEAAEWERGRKSKIRARHSTRNRLLYNAITGPEGRRWTVRAASVRPKRGSQRPPPPCIGNSDLRVARIPIPPDLAPLSY